MDYPKPPKPFAIMCELFSRAASLFPVDNSYIQRILFSAMNGSYRLIHDPWERPAGYVCWADVNIETLCRLGRTGLLPSHHYEWDEGDITLLLDVTICPGSFKLGLAQLEAFMRERGSGAYAKRNTLTLFRYDEEGNAPKSIAKAKVKVGANSQALAGNRLPQRRKFVMGSEQSLATFGHIGKAERVVKEALARNIA